MPTDPRILLTALSTLALGACFDPALDLGDGAGSATDASTTTEPTGSTTDPDTTESEGDSTGPTDTDAPPVITAFTVDSSTIPQEQQTAGMVAFDVDAIDDVGIDHIEIYDGDELVATVDEIPYVTDLLLTSANNGTHLYSAIAYDTAGQTAESEVVPLSVSIVGGAMLELREDIADVQMTHAVSALPRVVISPSEEVTVLTTVREDAITEPRYGISAITYTDTLSLLWTDSRWPLEFGPYNAYMNFGHPIYRTSTSSWWTGCGMLGEVTRDRAVAIVDTTAEAFTSIEPLGPVEQVFASPVTSDSSGAVIFSPALGQLQKRPTLDGAPTWTVPVGDDENVFFTDILVAPDDTIIAAFSGQHGCPPDASHCVYKLSAEGDVLWTRTAPTSSAASTLGIAVSPEGNVALAGLADGPARLFVYDENGNLLTDQLLTGDPRHEVRDLVYDTQGALVVAGDLQLDLSDTDREAWAGRFDEQGNPIWFQVYDLDSDGGLTGIATNPKGKLFAVGWKDLSDQDFFGWHGRGWIAELSL
jgi:WD40 repeat protein